MFDNSIFRQSVLGGWFKDVGWDGLDRHFCMNSVSSWLPLYEYLLESLRIPTASFCSFTLASYIAARFFFLPNKTLIFKSPRDCLKQVLGFLVSGFFFLPTKRWGQNNLHKRRRFWLTVVKSLTRFLTTITWQKELL